MGLKDTNLLEGLNDVALDTGGRVTVVAGADTAAVLGAVELGEGANTDVLAEVDVTGNGGWRWGQLPCSVVMLGKRSDASEDSARERMSCPLDRIQQRGLLLTGTDVEPVGVVGSELLLGTSLDDVDPGGDLELTRALEVGRVGRDEVLGAV